MLSLELIRNDPDMVRRAMESRGASAPIDELLELDQQRRSAIAEADQLRARRNVVSRELGQAKERPAELIEEMRGVGSRIRELEDVIRVADEGINAHLLNIPNVPREDAPIGLTEESNVVERTVGELPTFDFEP
ncbi:MAG TPA: serine--tRNA ligase, partial [Dehalococcoidia bacterium]|nr:serine--tRNA ligase [Dehalococcoidia bacterium]